MLKAPTARPWARASVSSPGTVAPPLPPPTTLAGVTSAGVSACADVPPAGLVLLSRLLGEAPALNIEATLARGDGEEEGRGGEQGATG